MEGLSISIKFFPHRQYNSLRVKPLYTDVTDHSEFKRGKFYVLVLFVRYNQMHCLIIRKVDEFNEALKFPMRITAIKGLGPVVSNPMFN